MASRLQFGNIAMAHARQNPNNELCQVQQQSELIAYHMIPHLLNEAGVRHTISAGNGHSKNIRNMLARDTSFRNAISVLESSCKEMRPKYLKELKGLVDTLDVSDSQLYPNYLESCTKLMDDDIRWGRIAVLFFFTSVLAERLHKEGQSVKIDSLVGWLKTFVNDNLSRWILEHGGWGAIEGAVTVQSSKVATKSKDSSPGWLTWAAVGVGAVIVGALTIK